MAYDDNETPNNIAETVRDIMRDSGDHKPIETPDGVNFNKLHIVDLPETRKTHDLTPQIRAAGEYLKPSRRAGTANLADLASLIKWANRFKSPESVLYANPDMAAPSLTCIADYHAQGPIDVTTESGDATARHRQHKAVYNFPFSDEWKAWMAIADKPLEKDDLGEFIEAQAKDILDPTPAIIAGKVDDKNEPFENRLIETARKIEGRFGQLNQLLAMSKQFQVHEKSNLTVSTNRDTGEAQVQFVNEHSTPDGSALIIPNLIIIAIPVFMNGAPYRMACRFRYRKSGGTVRFILSPYNPEKSFDASLKEAIEQAETETDLPLFLGKPE